jgi:hypothetical protein
MAITGAPPFSIAEALDFQALLESRSVAAPWPRSSDTIDLPSLGALFDGGLEAVTPDSLIAFLGGRLDELDAAIAKEISAIENQGAMSSAISRQRELLDAIASEIRLATTDPSKKLELADITVEWNGRSMSAADAINMAGLQGDVAFTDADPSGGATPKSKVSLEIIEAASSKLEKAQKRLTSENDLRMLRLQDMMNRRGQIIQMVSNLIRAIQDGHKVVVGNMR